MSVRLRSLQYGLLVVILLLAGALYATIPPSPDQWFLDYTGWRLASGAVPYEDFADGNWPACHWLHAMSTLAFGNTPTSWRVFDYLLMLGCTVAASDLLRRIWGRSAAVWMMTLYPCLYVVLGPWFAGQRDIVAANLCFPVLWFYWRGMVTRQLAWQLGTGLILAFCILIKPTFGLLGIGLVAHAAVSVRLRTSEARNAALQILSAGLVSTLGIALGLLILALQGTHLSMFSEMAVEHLFLRYDSSAPSITQALLRGVEYAFTCWHWILVLSLLSLWMQLALGGKDKTAASLLFPVLWLTGLASYQFQVSAFPYTLGPIFAATVPILCAGLGILSAHLRTLRGWRRFVAWAVLLVVISGTLKKWNGTFQGSVLYLLGCIPASAHYGKFHAGDGISTWDAMELSDELRERIPPDGTILVWGRANVVNFLSRRRQPTRFHHNVILLHTNLPEPLKARRDAWFRDELETQRPAACLVNEEELDMFRQPMPSSVRFLREYLDEGYRPIRTIGRSRLYLPLHGS